MSYTPTTWTTGDTITATAMNKIEQGIANAGSVLICNTSYSNGSYVLDKTAQEIYEALLAGTPAYIKFQYGTPEDYSGTLYLAPIIRFTNYIYTDEIHIYASKPMVGTVSSKGNAGLSGVLVYSADGLDIYPAFDSNKTTVVNNSYMITAGIG